MGMLVVVGSRYQNTKNTRDYVVHGIAVNPDTDECIVQYRRDDRFDGNWWLSMDEFIKRHKKIHKRPKALSL